jgi:tetratricopeptide (TPR) repeat protein
MPLSTIVTQHVRAIEAFLASPDARALCVAVEPDLERVLIRVLSGRSERGREAFFGASAPFLSAAAFYAAIERSLLDEVAEGLAELRAEGVALPALEGMDRAYGAPGIGPEVLFVELLERLARTLHGHAAGVVMVIAVEEPVESERALAASIRALVEATGSPRIKYIFLDRAHRPRLEPLVGLPGERRRIAVEPLGDDPAARAEAFLADPRRRVLVWTAPAAATAESAAIAAGSRRVRERMPVRVAEIEIPFRTAHAFFDAAIAALGRFAAQKGLDPAAIRLAPETSGMGLPLAVAFAWVAERLARALPGDPTLVVVMRPAPLQAPPRALEGAILALADAAAAARVRFVIVDAPSRPLPRLAPPAEAPPAVLARSFDLPLEGVERGLEERAADPAASPLERARVLSMIAGLASTRKEFDRALARSQEAVLASQKLDDPAEESIAWLGRGHVLYRMGEHALARDAYVQATALAQGRENHVLAGQGLVSMGHTFFCERALGRAIDCYAAGLRHYDAVGNVFGACHALVWLGEARRGHGQRAPAVEALADALARYDALGAELEGPARQGRLEALARLARMLGEDGRTREAADAEARIEALGGAPSLRSTP